MIPRRIARRGALLLLSTQLVPLFAAAYCTFAQ